MEKYYYATDRKDHTETHFFACQEKEITAAKEKYATELNEDIDNFSFTRRASETEIKEEIFDKC